ncbi:MLO-like protein 3 [Andrographis paniculata]|uniref:MLO-like protein 3 n=1 Tax=Andrographis paniculata TaxID=175694 RepID=UPI0021E85B75|nr:MLO-like protein 3 [Andrographis paniculata]
MGGFEEEEEVVEHLSSLLHTPTWAVATVCFVFIFLGIFIDHLIHLVGHWLKKHKKAALYDAIEKLKSVLMLLGFMSLILSITQSSILKICIPDNVADSMLPCRQTSPTKTIQGLEHIRTLNSQTSLIPTKEDIEISRHFSEATSNYEHNCSEGKTPMMSPNGINQLNIFIFVLAIMQIVSSVATMALGRAKMKRWKTWEKETHSLEYAIANDPERFRITRETTFGRRHATSENTNPTLMWIKCFLRQFFNSVAKIDYLTLRHGFVSAHFSSNNIFNFQKYIQRSLEHDFKEVIGISPIMWLVVVIFLVLDVHGWNAYLWISFLPLIVVLFIGTKLGVIVTKMAIHLTNQNTVIRGTPLVQPNNNLFWFENPRLVLIMLHFALFMNSFEFAFFVWVTWQFGLESCYHEYVEVIVVRVVLAVLVQIICSYVTLPLYALVTQMGSQYKSEILVAHTIQGTQRRKEKGKIESSIPESSIQNHSSVTNNNDETSSLDESCYERRQDTATSFVSLHGSEIVEEFETIYQCQRVDTNRRNSHNEIQLS